MQTAISVLGVDIGKNVCSLVGLDACGKVVLRRRAKRETLIALAAKLPPCISLRWKPVAARIISGGSSPCAITTYD